MKIQNIPQLSVDGVKITTLIRFLLVLCIIVAGTAVKPHVVEAAAKPGWIVSCMYSHSLNDDPIVFPGQVGASHLHDFAGAKTANAFSTFNSLLAGGTTCAMPGDTSSYWVPALYEDGIRILPQARSGNTVFYYRRIGAPDGTIVKPFPPGLRIIIGNARAMSPQENFGLGTTIVFRCGPGEGGTPLPAPPTQCDSGIMVMSLSFPNCWDGVNLDSVDHRSHMAYPVNSRCPASHPVNLPRLESFFRYIVGTGPIGTITLDSGPYYTAHQDFFNAWNPATLQTLVTNCINAGIDCGTNPSVPPGSFAKLSPANNATNISSIMLSWAGSPGATSYQYCFSPNLNDNNCVHLSGWTDVGNVTSYTIPVANDPRFIWGNTYYWQIRASNSAGTRLANDDTWWAFTTANLVGRATLLSPRGSIIESIPTFRWNNVTGTTWYYLWINGPSGNVFKQWYQTTAICSGGTCAVTPSITLPPGNFTWWVQTWSPTGYGQWSDGMTFNTPVVTPPGTAALISPNGSISDTTPNYTWNSVSGSTWYYLWVSKVNSDGSLTTAHTKWYDASVVCSGATCSISPDGVTLTSGNYRWWIQTWNTGGYGPWSNLMNFSLP